MEEDLLLSDLAAPGSDLGLREALFLRAVGSDDEESSDESCFRFRVDLALRLRGDLGGIEAAAGTGSFGGGMDDSSVEPRGSAYPPGGP